MRNRESGLSLVELLVSLVVVGLLATAIFTFFLQTSQSVGQQSANGEMWQRGRNALALMRQAIESAGYGLPNFDQCLNGVVGVDTTTTGATAFGATALVAVTASTQSAGSGYQPSVGTYQFSTVTGSGAYGGVPTTTVNSQSGATVKVDSTTNLFPGDLALIVPQAGSSGVCVLGVMTNVSGKGILNQTCTGSTGQGNGNGGGGNTVVFNAGKGKSACFQANPNQIFSLANPSTGATPSLTNASLYDLGSNDFVFATFQIESPGGSTPTLYMTQYTGMQLNPPAAQALASGVVDLQIQYGVGANGSVQSWVWPENYTPSLSQSIVAVQLAMLIRSTQYLPNSVSPATFNLLGRSYSVPTSNGPGCLQGNCRHYEYHLFQTIVPVRNGIWGERVQ